MGGRFVSIWFPHLLTDWHSRKQPHLRKVPFVLVTSKHNRTLIAAANPLALAEGIRPGMALADARALVPALEAVLHKEALTQQLPERIAEWCIRFTPTASPCPPDKVLLDASGCTHLWTGDQAYLQNIHDRLTARGYTVRLAIADTPGAAWALSRYGPDALTVVPPDGQRDALLSLPPAALRLDPDLVQRLHTLGLYTINSLLAITSTALRRRFGPSVVQRIAQALGKAPEPLQGIFPPVEWSERLPCLEPITTRSGLDLALQHLLSALCTRLRAEGKGLHAATFRGYRSDGATSGIQVGTARPTANEKHLLSLFTLKLDTFRPGSGIELFLLEATTVEDLPPSQDTLWRGTGATDDLAHFLDRVAGKLGAAAIQRFLPAERWWPEQSFTPAASLSDQPSTSWPSGRPRPVYLLSPPESIEVTAPIPDYPPMNFRYKGQLHTITAADGPERIEQEWWVQEGEHRDYYYVEDDRGRRYWLFRSGHYGADHQWFLHGFFP